jgi:thioredoxin-like negative regulator of GroEL
MLVEPLLPPVPDGARGAGPLQSPQLSDGADDHSEALEEELRPLWHRRFLDDSPRLREIAAGLARLTEVESIDPAADGFVAALAELPYVSNELGESIVTLVRRLVEANQTAAAERVLAHFPATQILGLLRYGGRLGRLLPVDSPALAWLIERATGPERARILASIGGEAVVKNPAVAPAIVAAMPQDTDSWSWKILLSTINNHLGALWNKKSLVVAEQLSDAIQPIAKHNAQIYLWTATIYIAQGRVDDAMTQIELMFDAGYREWQRVRGDKDFAPLFENPRFLALKSQSASQ